MKSELILRKLTNEEIPKLGPMIDALGEFHNKISSTTMYPPLSRDETLALLQQNLGKTCFIIGGYKENELIGFIQYAIKNDAGSIDRLYIAPDSRGLGLGRKLMKAALDHLQDSQLKRIDVQVLTQNQAAMALYESFGFAPRLITLTKQ